MFSGFGGRHGFNSALSDCNKLSTHTNFAAHPGRRWASHWASVTCPSPSPPPPESPPEPPAAPPASAFSDKASLQVALGEWCADAAAAQASHGLVAWWDVSAVTDMALMTDHLPWTCRSTFNEDLNAWDVGKVTNMEVRRRPRWEPEVLGGGGGGGDPLPCTLGHQHGASVRWCSAYSPTITHSTSPWKRGTLARSPTWRFAAARAGSWSYRS